MSLKSINALEEMYGPDRLIAFRHKKQRRDGLMYYPPCSPQVPYKYSIHHKTKLKIYLVKGVKEPKIRPDFPSFT